MCGIAGIVDFRGQSVDPCELKKLGDSLRHRGPDGDGIYRSENVGLCHRRLAIIDPASGQQPFYSDNRSVVLTYNGEVYNYRELRAELQNDFNFTTQSDTEVVVKAYQKWGIECVTKFRGMFAFGLHDASSGNLYLARDRVGIKPLYYCVFDGRLAFASELHALLCLPWVPRDVSETAVTEYFRRAYVSAPETIYRGIFKLEPGHYLSLHTETGKLAKHRYWKLPRIIREEKEGDFLEELDSLLDETIKIYVRSDVPFGAFLSGGVDSSLVTALMSRSLDLPVETFSIGFSEAGHSELAYAREASLKLQTNHHEKTVTPDFSRDAFTKLAHFFGEPFADSSAIPTFFVAQEAASKVKMVLSGDGGDELFAGYNSYALAWRDAHDPLWAAKSLLYGLLSRLAPGTRTGQTAGFRAMSVQDKHDAQRRLFSELELQRLLPGSAREYMADNTYVTAASGADVISLFQAGDFDSYLPDDVLAKVDRMSMANSLEVRVPLLDHKIVEFAFSLPLNMKIRLNPATGGPETKYLLKQSAARYFPASFLGRPKQGFGIPIIEWCRGALMPAIRDRMLNPSNQMFDWVSHKVAKDMLTSFTAGNNADVAKIWSLMMFDAWLIAVHSR